MGKQIWQPVDPKNFGSDVSVRPRVQTLGEGEGSPTTGGGGMPPSFLVDEVNNMAAGSSYARFSIR